MEGRLTSSQKEMEGRLTSSHREVEGRLTSSHKEMEKRLASSAELDSLRLLVNNVSDSVIREIGEAKESMARMNVRLDKIAAGSHYVGRLVAWSEKQDKFQEDLLRRVQLERWRDQKDKAS